jgi:hypothetical protein
MASMPRKAIAPAIPAPATTVGYEAAPVAGMSVPEGEPPVVVSVAEETVLMTVELEPMVEALMDAPVPAAVVIAVPEETTTVDVATALVDDYSSRTCRRSCFCSGRGDGGNRVEFGEVALNVRGKRLVPTWNIAGRD